MSGDHNMHQKPRSFVDADDISTERVDETVKAQHEPVAYLCEFFADQGYPFLSFEPVRSGTNQPLYKHALAPRKPLTDEDIESLWDNVLFEDVGITALRKITRAIEAAHGIKESA